MRISGGKARGITLKAPKGSQTRPSSDATREALFSSLGDWIVNCCFADLFAGTGAYGIEAWSRGAGEGIFVEMDRGACRCINENLRAAGQSMEKMPRGLNAIQRDVFKCSELTQESFDIVFADPPYDLLPDIAERLFKLAAALLKPETDTLFILEMPARFKYEPQGWEQVKRLGKKRGSGPALTFWKKVR